MSQNKITNDLLRSAELGELLTQLNSLKLSFAQSKERKEFIETLKKEEEALNVYLKDLLEECAEKDKSGDYVYTDDTQQFIKLKKDKKEEYQSKVTETYSTEMKLPKLSMDIIEKLDLSPIQFVIIETLLAQD